MKNRAEKVKEMMDHLDSAYNDININKRPDLKKMILEYATELEKTEDVDLLSSRLCKRISIEYLENKKDFPKSVIDLYYFSRGKGEKYDAIALSAIMAGSIWF